MNLFLVIIALLLIVCIDHEVRINRLENDNDIIEGVDYSLLGPVLAVGIVLAFIGSSIYRERRPASESVANVSSPSIRDYA